VKSYRSYLFEQCIANFIINFALTYVFGALALSNVTDIPLFAPQHDPFHPNIAGDLIVGTVITGLAVTLIVTFITRTLFKFKKIELIETQIPTLLKSLPQSLVWRGLAIGGGASFLVALPITIALYLLGITNVPASDYLLWHGLYVALIGSAMACLVCLKSFEDELIKQ
jgi:hypothetical protein